MTDLQSYPQTDLSQLVRQSQAYYANECDAEALAALIQVSLVYPDTDTVLFDTFLKIAKIYLKNENFDASEEYLNKAYTLNPVSDEILITYGVLSLKQGKFQDAIQKFRLSLTINKSNPIAWYGLALMHESLGDWELAKANFEASLAIKSFGTKEWHLINSLAEKNQDNEWFNKIHGEESICPTE